MGITVSQDFDDLERLISALDDPGAILDDIGASLAEETISLVREGFAKSADPYGSSWAARKSGGGSRILVRTGAMRNSFNVRRGDRTGFGVAASVGYATFHQRGTSRMVPRKMVPNQGDIPPTWRARFDEVAEEVIEEHVR